MDIKYKPLFFIDKEGNQKEGYKPDGKLRLRIRYSMGKIDFNIGYRVDIDKWSTETQRCKKGTTHGKKKVSASEINGEIQRFEKLTEDVFKFFEVKGRIPTLEEFRAIFNKTNKEQLGTYQPPKQNLLFVFDIFMHKAGLDSNWQDPTYIKFKNLRNHLEKYNPDLDLSSLTKDDLRGFLQYAICDADLQNTTIERMIRNLRRFLKWCNSEDEPYYRGNLHNTWKPNLPGIKEELNPVIYLDWDELMKLYNFDLQKTYLKHVRDVFCFCSFTGLRYSDVSKLTQSNIKNGKIEIVSHKDIDPLQIELNKYSQGILDRYEGVVFKKGRLLPVISNQNYNDYLKELGQLIELNEPIQKVWYQGSERKERIYKKWELFTTHVARKTFVVNAQTLGIPLDVIMKWTGHSSRTSMKPYTKIVNKLKEESMNKFNEI